MKFAGSALLAATLLLAGVMPVAAQDLDRELFNPILGSIVKVEAVTEAGGYSLGSAVPVSAGHFVTSCHVTAKAVSISIQYQGLRWPVRGQRADGKRDLCMLDVPKLSEVPAVRRSSSRNLKVGDGVVAIGYTFGAGLSTQVGKVRALHAIDDGTVIQSATYFNSGASGGGLFTLDGRLVGILTFRLKGAEAYYFSVPADWIESESASDGSYLPIAPLGDTTPFWSQPADRLPYFMRAAALQARERWPDLLMLTQDWVAAESSNPEPWFIRGEVFERLDRHNEAVAAFQKTTELNPQLALAWMKLGEAELRLRHLDTVQKVIKRLDALDAELAAELRVRSGIKP